MIDRINKITDEGGEFDKKAKDLRVGLFIPQENETGGVA